MSLRFRGLAAWVAVAVLLGSSVVQAAETKVVRTTEKKVAKTVLVSDRDKVSYMIGADVGRSITGIGPDLDLAAFERAIRNAFAGGKPLIADAEARTIGIALMQRIAERSGQPRQGVPPGTALPVVAKDKVGFLVGADVGRSLTPVRDEIDITVFMQALTTMLAGGKPLLTDAEMDIVRDTFSKRMDAKAQAMQAEAASKNATAGTAFLAKNKITKGVFTTSSGLQYTVLRQGSGKRPRPTDRVRVNYHGTLLDGTVFDSSYDRGQASDFMLNQVIAGWTEGLSLMPVGARYRFWIPPAIAYGEHGNPPVIAPNSTLVFDVELLEVY